MTDLDIWRLSGDGKSPFYDQINKEHLFFFFRYFEYAKDTSKVKSQDFFTVISYIASTPIGRNLAWDWVRMNWEYLVNR